MTTNYEASRPSELSDAELTDMLAAADYDLMNYVSAGANPAAALLTIMDGRQSHPSVRKQASDAAAVLKMRSMARALGRHLDSDIECANILIGGINRVDGRAHMLMTALSGARVYDAGLVHNRTEALYHNLVFCADNLVRDLSAVHDVAIDLMDRAAVYVDELHAGTAEFAEVIGRALDGINDLSRFLNRACALANDLGDKIACRSAGQGTIAVILDRARELAGAYDSLRIRVRAIVDDLHLATVLNPARELTWVQVDASGVDLSGVLFNDLDVLIDVIWTSDTTWPAGVLSEVYARSEIVGPGVYQVRRRGVDLKHLTKV